MGQGVLRIGSRFRGDACSHRFFGDKNHRVVSFLTFISFSKASPLPLHVPDFAPVVGEPPGTRTQGPRLKSTNTSEGNQCDDSSKPSNE